MGATNQVLQLEGISGASYSYSLYFAGGDAAGYRVPVSQYLAAAAGGEPQFTIPEPCRIKYITGPATGTLRVLADGVATPILLNTAAILAKAADSRVYWGQLGAIRAGTRVRYSLVVEVAMAA